MISPASGEPRPGLAEQQVDRRWRVRLGLAEIVAGLAFVGVACYFLIAAQEFAHISFNPNDPGPASFPRTMGILLLVCSLALAVLGVRRLRDVHDESALVDVVRPLHVLGGIAVSFVYAFAMPYLGYHIATAIWFPVLLMLSGVTNWKSLILWTVVFIIGADIAFARILGVIFP